MLHSSINNTNTKIEVAKIHGNLWIRGYIYVETAMQSYQTVLTFNNLNYAVEGLVYSTSTKQSHAPTLQLASPSGNDYSNYDACSLRTLQNSVHPAFVFQSSSYYSGGYKRLIATCIGKLI